MQTPLFRNLLHLISQTPTLPNRPIIIPLAQNVGLRIAERHRLDDRRRQSLLLHMIPSSNREIREQQAEQDGPRIRWKGIGERIDVFFEDLGRVGLAVQVA